MTYLEIVQNAFQKAGLRATRPTTLADAIDITLDFKTWAQDSWRELQEESENWWFRQRLDQTLNVRASTTDTPDQYYLTTYNEWHDPGMDNIASGYTSSYSLPPVLSFTDTPGYLIKKAADVSGYYFTNPGYLTAGTEYSITFDLEAYSAGDPISLELSWKGTSLGVFTTAGRHTVTFTTASTVAATDYLQFDGVSGSSLKIDNFWIVPTSVLDIGDSYKMPAGLETLNWRTVSIYTVAGQDEVLMTPVQYENWRTNKDTVASAEGRPWQITERPDSVLQIWPVPDQAYTIRYDGVWDIDEMLIDTDTPGFNLTGAQTLPSRYHWVLVYNTALKYAQHHSDPTLAEQLEREYRAQHARLRERNTPPVSVPPGVLTGMTPGQFRRIY